MLQKKKLQKNMLHRRSRQLTRPFFQASPSFFALAQSRIASVARITPLHSIPHEKKTPQRKGLYSVQQNRILRIFTHNFTTTLRIEIITHISL
jgi:hypothetical protein